MSIEEHERALEYCTLALELKPDYHRVRERKVRVLLKLGKAREAKEELENGPVPDPLRAQVEKEAAEQFERDKDEVLGKLKDLGNTVLGKFGLNLNNFQMQQNENGSYNINFQQ